LEFEKFVAKVSQGKEYCKKKPADCVAYIYCCSRQHFCVENSANVKEPQSLTKASHSSCNKRPILIVDGFEIMILWQMHLGKCDIFFILPLNLNIKCESK